MRPTSQALRTRDGASATLDAMKERGLAARGPASDARCAHVPAAKEAPVRSPVSSRGWLILQEVLEGAVLGGVVGGVVLPAVPGDVGPGAGEDACCVWVVVAACAGAGVEVGGPGVGAAGVGGEVGDGVAQL